MKKNNKNVIASVTTLAVLVFSSLLGFVGSPTALAATTPSLGAAGTYGILSNLFQHNIATTTITGNPANSPSTGVLGYSSEAGVGTVVVVNGTTYVNDANWTAAGGAQNTAKSNLDSQSCTPIGVIVDLASYDVDGAGGLPPGTFPPGCYSSSGAMSIGGGGTVTLQGAGTYIFRPDGALNTTAGSIVTLSGASACDVFWTPTAAATLGANSTFVGTILDPSGVTMSNLAAVTGRILAYGGTVTADTNTVTVPVCAAATPTPAPADEGPTTGTVNVVKTVINDNGGTKLVSDFPLYVNGTLVVSGVTRTFDAPGIIFSVTESNNANYATSFSGDCDMNGQFNLNGGQNRFCIITNDDIGAPVVVPPVPPLIDVVKVPNPLALPSGPGPVTYTYTLRNIGTVPVTNITMVGDTCSPIVLVSGDTNNDLKLDVNETWVHRCTTTLTETHTNTVTATGWANGISAVDVATARVVVGQPLVPPLIHIVKKPSALVLPQSGPVTYTFTVTNPGTVALSNVAVYDNKCSPASAHSGDVNGNNMLDVSETWVYSCQTNLASNTVNTATATGMANGLTAVDLSVATVLVTPPGLPNTGIAPDKTNVLSYVLTLIGMFTVSAFFFLAHRRQVN